MVYTIITFNQFVNKYKKGPFIELLTNKIKFKKLLKLELDYEKNFIYNIFRAHIVKKLSDRFIVPYFISLSLLVSGFISMVLIKGPLTRYVGSIVGCATFSHPIHKPPQSSESGSVVIYEKMRSKYNYINKFPMLINSYN